MRSRMSCTGTVTGAPNSELERIEQGAPQRGVPSAALCLPPHSLTHLSMSPRQRASPENLCRSRRRVWASASSEGDSNVSAPGLSYCMGAGQTHSHLYLPAPPPFRWRTHPHSTYCLLPSNQQPPLVWTSPLVPSPHPQGSLTPRPGASAGPYLPLHPHTGPRAGCAERPAGCAAPAPSCPCASGPGRSRPPETAAGSNTRRPTAGERGDPVRGESTQPWIPTPPAPRKMEVRALGGEMEWKKGQKDTDGDREAEGVY